MFGSSVASENIIAKYNARFKPNPEGEGYLFFKDNYGAGVNCSTEQYHAYASEFEAFFESRQRLMWLWLILIIVVAIIGFILAERVWDFNPDKFPRYIGGIFMILPLLLFYKQGYTLYKKPVNELYADYPDLPQRKQNSREIRKQRLKGMSSSFIILGLVVPVLGLFFSLTDIVGGYEAPYWEYFFGALILFFLFLAWGKYKAHKEDDAILLDQKKSAGIRRT